MFDSPDASALWRNMCMVVSLLAAGYIGFLGFRRYKTDPTWQLVAVGALVLAMAYAAILGTSGFGDSFFGVTHRGAAVMADYAYFLKAGVLLAVLGAFSVSKKLLP